MLAQRGLEYLNYVIEHAEPTPIMYQRKARLYIAGNDKKPNAEAIEAYDLMLAMLDQNPENMNRANPNNALQLYKEAYAFEQLYASITGNEEGTQTWGQKYREVMNLINGTTEQ